MALAQAVLIPDHIDAETDIAKVDDASFNESCLLRSGDEITGGMRSAGAFFPDGGKSPARSTLHGGSEVEERGRPTSVSALCCVAPR